MHFVERIIVNILHAVVEDGPCEDVANICQRIQHLNQIPRTCSFSILLHFFGEEFDAKFNQFIGSKGRRVKLGDLKGLIKFKQGSNNRVHDIGFSSRLKNLPPWRKGMAGEMLFSQVQHWLARLRIQPPTMPKEPTR